MDSACGPACVCPTLLPAMLWLSLNPATYYHCGETTEVNTMMFTLEIDREEDGR